VVGLHKDPLIEAGDTLVLSGKSEALGAAEQQLRKV
jgi:K+/H+ antiporter YhaU regulatory subunit KhtT